MGSTKIATVTSSEVRYYFQDHLGSTNVVTNSAGSQIELVEYKPFGEFSKRVQTGTSNAAWYYFTGKPLDDETGLMFYGARYYSPVLGRFLTPDTIVQDPYNPQTLNRYTYCNNNPVNYVDPSGHSWKKFWKAVAGIVVGVVATLVLGPGGALAWYGSTMAGIVGGALGGAVSGGLSGGWKGALIGAGLGGVLGGIGGKLFGASGSSASNSSKLADASVDLGTIVVMRDAGGSALGDAAASASAGGVGATAGKILSSAIASAMGSIVGAATSAASSIASAAHHWAYESAVPGPFGQPLSEWQGGQPTNWGDPMKYTEKAGGGWQMTERAFVGLAVGVTAMAGGSLISSAISGQTLMTTRLGSEIFWKGGEFVFSKNGQTWLRINPFGDWSSTNIYGRFPHYHRRITDAATGVTKKGGGIHWHRPWEGGF